MSEVICETHKIREYQPECRLCRGEGEIDDDDDCYFTSASKVKCYRCNGTGLAPYTECELCVEESVDDPNP